MRAETGTSSNGSNECSADLAVPESTVTLVTVIVGTVVGLTFLFGFGNVLALGLRLGVPIWVAPLASRGFSQTEGSSARTQGSNPARTGVDP
ncbi:hypothetical protein Franean1_3576 [Parafrankia sp. EAN1pec]|nr:hypothetical protein Franean1_3576 [Frankia sp. EAN1pec]